MVVLLRLPSTFFLIHLFILPWNRLTQIANSINLHIRRHTCITIWVFFFFSLQNRHSHYHQALTEILQNKAKGAAQWERERHNFGIYIKREYYHCIYIWQLFNKERMIEIPANINKEKLFFNINFHFHFCIHMMMMDGPKSYGFIHTENNRTVVLITLLLPTTTVNLVPNKCIIGCCEFPSCFSSHSHSHSCCSIPFGNSDLYNT